MPRLIIESDTYKARSSLNGLFQFLTLAFSCAAIYISIVHPFNELIKERNNDLLSYRACFAVRYSDSYIPKIERGEKLDDIVSIETILFSVDQVKITELPDPNLVEGFIEIRRATHIFERSNKKDMPLDKKLMDDAKLRADAAMKSIDKFILNENLPTDKFTGGCFY